MQLHSINVSLFASQQLPESNPFETQSALHSSVMQTSSGLCGVMSVAGVRGVCGVDGEGSVPGVLGGFGVSVYRGVRDV